MDARRTVAKLKRIGANGAEMATARAAVNEAKVALGERGPVWWDDDAPDLTRRMAKNTAYADWYAQARTNVEDAPPIDRWRAH